MELLIDLIGTYTLTLRTDYFTSLVRAITGQQLSVKAAQTIWQRIINLCGGISPDIIARTDENVLRTAGLSRSKVSYIKDLAGRVLAGEVVLGDFDSLDDQRIVSMLTAVKGIGKWTAEMFLIFSLGRPDIFSVDDVGLQRSIKWLYGLSEPPKAKEMLKYGEAWKPYRTAASLYLWEAINRGHVLEDAPGP